MKKILVLIILNTLMITPPGYADLILLKNNMYFDCIVIEETDTGIEIKTNKQTVTFKKTDIKGVFYDGNLILPPQEEYRKRLSNLALDDAHAQFNLGMFCFKNQLLSPALKHFQTAQNIDSAYSPKTVPAIKKIKKTEAQILWYLTQKYYRQAEFTKAYELLTVLLKEHKIKGEKSIEKAKALLPKIEEKLESPPDELDIEDELYEEKAAEILKNRQIIIPNNFPEHEKVMDVIAKQDNKKAILIKYLKEAGISQKLEPETIEDLKKAYSSANVVYSIIAFRHALHDKKLMTKALSTMDIIQKKQHKFLNKNYFILFKKNLEFIKAVLFALPLNERTEYCYFYFKSGESLKQKAQQYRFTNQKKYKAYLKTAVKCFAICFACNDNVLESKLAVLMKQNCEEKLESIGQKQTT